MWILPKQLHTLDYVLDTEGLSLDSKESSQLCAQSLFVRSKPSLARTWLQKWKRDSWTQHLYGRILKPSHGQSFLEKWTSCLADIPASPSQPLANALEQKTSDIFGPTSQAEFAFSSPESASLKMSKDTLVSDSEKSLANWNKWVTKCRGEYLARLNAVRATNESGSSSWPTATTRDWKDTGDMSQSMIRKDGKERMDTLGRVVQAKSWPTPDTNNHRDGTTLRKDNNLEQGGFHGVSLHHAMLMYGQAGPDNPNTHGSRQGLLPTARSLDGQVGESLETWEARHQRKAAEGINLHRPLPIAVEQEQRKQWATPQLQDGHNIVQDSTQHKTLPAQLTKLQMTGKLNPRWVCVLMNLPVFWVKP
jgi:hypothetical protein